MKLLTSQKNSLFELIQKVDFFSHNQFELIEKDITGVFNTHIEYKANKDFYFRFIDSNYVNSMFVNHSPGDQQIMDSSSKISWDETLSIFYNWLYYLQREVTSPNLWQQFKTEISEIKYINNFSNQKFSFSEYTEISEKIDVLKNSLSSIPLILNQQNEIILRLDHLSETAKELGKFDWINLFIGTIISVVIQLNVTPENANAIWDLIKRVFNNYFLPK
ncbi:conserved hypothetical protein [Flavobacterium psychrophilum]|uniref:Uncharacterized protein n=1 Tax=Flavobacterium psychrophilum TaxID=96345 RepID=A0A7U2NER1_FLAPS|nr:hypothetical protein [Flavobacterium psychrophilum]MCB6061178.1 hypothetical protein [Flavobacterium psychrophilum]QRE03776.1 hypothetical protein H0H26_12985 [Flavobacterium psychrophilum]SNB43619.1 conserved hypothetical protein [Flavobacterium psychrophilum]